ncbi:outer membrane protein assembly factor BamA [Marinimicrobium sp. ABcell2]|uniref:outer membrane protein assembly factor BamA n=1 Tax=Marinimicrobium sp. ABcell2 TaxID=3069751 RepID=UPI0027B86AA1|nr:outer membrane protein assembly factor BamA [Marinimicrobium sp. ABcell2]MDQ2075332.1 outer membrane protein assembly factor BamA [Marinimicrobium sp. ABcell2]
MRFISLVVLLLISLGVQAQEFEISDIRVEGLQRVSAGSVFSALPVRVGDTLTSEDIQRATRALFRVGHFADVTMVRDGDVLVVQVKERPAINEIVIEGNKVIKTDALMESLRDNGLSEGQIFQRATLELISQSLEREYIGQGRYGASVSIEIEDLPRNQVKVLINVNEGKPARIRSINIVGNEVYRDKDLLDLFELSARGLFSWITGDDKYSREKLSGDIERLESYYLDRGYLDFRVDSTQVALSPDRSKIYITINVTEGEVYTVNAVELAGDPVLPERAIRQLIMVREGDTFSQIMMTTSADYIKQRLGNEGYTFAEVEGIPERNQEDKTVDVTFFIDPGERAYVRRINFRGNTKTIDEVLRREMRQMEGGAASTSQIEHSRVRLNRLGFFKDVDVETVEVPGTSDQIDVEYTVEEAPSGSMGLQVGYARYSGLLLSANIHQNNWFGTGKRVGMSLSNSRFRTAYNFSYEDPYFTRDGVSRGFNLYYSKSNFANIGVAGYGTDVYGARMSFGYPISEIERIGFSLEARDLTVKASGRSAQEIIRTPVLPSNAMYITQSDASAARDEILRGRDFPEGIERHPVTEDVLGPPGYLDAHGNRFRDLLVTLNWGKSTLNRGMLATRGTSQRISLEAALPGGDLDYYKLQYNAETYKPLTRHLTLKLRTNLGYANSYRSDRDLPFFEHFYAGGFGSVRGFERNSLGPRTSPPEQAFQSEFAWDDRDGDGLAQQSELARTYVLCEDPEGLNLNSFTCRPGELITQRTATREQLARRDSRYSAFGGNILVEAGAEILFPLPFIDDQRSMQSSFFIEGGNVFSEHCRPEQLNCYGPSLDRISISAGFGLTWITGFGPLTFSVSRPLNENDGDDPKFFDFTIGGAF